MKKYLVYYTHGYEDLYLDIMKLSIKTLRDNTDMSNIDILVMSDNKYVERIKSEIENVYILPMNDSKRPDEASMHKLNIFDFSKIYEYEAVMFIDSDILVYMDVGKLLEKVVRSDVFYVCTEKIEGDEHKSIIHSLLKYTDEEYKFLTDNNIIGLNAGCFLLKPSKENKAHFDNIHEMIRNHTDDYFYEQSFMNHYFNLNGQTDRTLLTTENYILWPKIDVRYENSLLHFCGSLENKILKIENMELYIKKFPYK